MKGYCRIEGTKVVDSFRLGESIDWPDGCTVTPPTGGVEVERTGEPPPDQPTPEERENGLSDEPVEEAEDEPDSGAGTESPASEGTESTGSDGTESPGSDPGESGN